MLLQTNKLMQFFFLVKREKEEGNERKMRDGIKDPRDR